MNEASVFQVDAYMGGTPLVAPIVEKDEVAFTQLGFAHLAAILGALAVGASFQTFAVDREVDVAGKSRAVHAAPGGSSRTVRYAYPVCRFNIEAVIIVHVDIHIEA